MMSVQQPAETETEILGQNPPECSFAHLKYHMTCPILETDRRGGKPTTRSLIYGTTTPLPQLKDTFIAPASKRSLIINNVSKNKPSIATRPSFYKNNDPKIMYYDIN
jgi:hypothetical protein